MDFNPILFRHQLHRHPEVSGKENWTANYIANTLRQLGYKPVTGIGGYGIVVSIKGPSPGPNLLFRADIDALPIPERSTHDHISENKGIMHACGHDGHAASLMSLAHQLRQQQLQRGSVHMIFQPAEENGTGARAMLKDDKWKQVDIDYCFGYHNIPGYPIGQILTRTNTFSYASTGMIVEYEGSEAHAAYPEDGNDPTQPMMKFIEATKSFESAEKSKFFITLVHLHIGKPAFATTPGKSKVMVTIRSNSNKVFRQKCTKIEQLARKIAQENNLSAVVQWKDKFRAIVNHREANLILSQACKELGFDTENLPEAMRWSEDFSHFSDKWPAAFFGIGSGSQHTALQEPDYDFPDTLIDISSKVFEKIIRNLNGLK
ncbi:hydrolase [Veronia nyctiphanis]|uniref:Hydrolase n=1 Tax=Veronia nyctiphanis TaxID=1278244 RepID=A0A4Q0YP14_9GAMM|nr:amidohydrolase [Veronia nyctiphanis]RXJ72243.1 hydrolase [Veronia nyctiphanis]